VTSWDVVEKALLPADADDYTERADASTVDTYKRADGLVILVDARFNDTLTLAADIITTAPAELPILLFSNFNDVEDAEPIIPESLQRFMGRFYFIPGSLKTGQGLTEVLKWLVVPLLSSKKKQYYNLYRAAESDLMALNLEFTTTAEFFVEVDSARQHMPVYVPPPVEKPPEPEPEPEPPQETQVEPEPVVSPVSSAVEKTGQEDSLFDEIENVPVAPVPAPAAAAAAGAAAPAKKTYEKPYRRRQQQQTGARAKVITKGGEEPPPEKPPPAPAREKAPPAKPLKSEVEPEKVPTAEPEKVQPVVAEKVPVVEKVSTPPPPKPVPVPEPVEILPKIETLPEKAPAPEADEGDFWGDGDDDDEPKVKAPVPAMVVDDDDEDLRPNPLVTGRGRAVDLRAAIKSQEELIEEQKKELNRPPPTEVVADADDEEEPVVQSAGNDYGDLDAVERVKPTKPAPAEAPKKVPRAARQRFRGRGRVGQGSKDPDDAQEADG
jgi:hypothetical protein